MRLLHAHKVLTTLIILAGLLIGFTAIQALIIILNGKPMPVPDIPRDRQKLGKGPALTLAILGDSTSISQGGDYTKGIAVAVAEHLAVTHTVTYQNFGVSGARMADVRNKQLPQALVLKPDIVLLAVTANDVTHLTPINSIKKDMQSTVVQLRAANPNVKIVVTGAPQMGSVPRFPQPTRWLAKLRTEAANTMLRTLAGNHSLVFAPIADKTGPLFAANPGLFAQDKFHPNTQGYNLWIKVLLETL